MVSSILTCPKCDSLIMEDTAICPGCHHVLKDEHAPIVQQAIKSSESFDGSHESPCRECEAMNRDGLVRCWQCGAFLKEEIEKVYLAMQSRPSSVISSDEVYVDEEAPAESDVYDSPMFDDDFELSENVEMIEGQYFDEEQSAGEVPLLEADESEEPETIPLMQESAPSVAADPEPDEADEDEELLKLAVREERELSKQTAKRKRNDRGTFLMKGPCGDCKIRVQKYHQGMLGQCPKCTLPFVVPILPTESKKGAALEKATPKAERVPENWVDDAKWQEIVVKKFKPKAGALAGKGDTVDVTVHDDGLLFVWPEKKGLMGPNKKQVEATRSEVAAHLSAGHPLEKLPAPRHEWIAPELLAGVRLVQPWPITESEIPAPDADSANAKSDEAPEQSGESPTESDFTGGLELFTVGQVTLEIPAPPQPDPNIQADADAAAATAASASAKFAKKKKPPKKKKTPKPVEPPVRCVTLTISQYRKVRQWLATATNNDGFLQHETLPLETTTKTWTCALSEQTFEALEQSEVYAADSTEPTTTVGWLCQCGEVAISEAARAEQKFGGKKPAGLAKAKCPTCEQPFGQNPLIHLTSVVAPPPPEPPKDDSKTGKKGKKNNKETESKTKSGDDAQAESKQTAAPITDVSPTEVGTATETAADNKAVEVEPADDKPASKKKGLFGLFGGKKVKEKKKKKNKKPEKG